ncbi:hypothetical protein BDL97_02G033100 [Sphagnum fallax]|jgi:hypothetical protein|nr:hypothetical protein BDL97_02G033100 [Sphagnum fallax]
MASAHTTMKLLRRAMATATEAAVKVPLKKPGEGHPKRKNLFDVVKVLPNWGVGSKVAKSHWRPETFYKITEIKLYKDPGHGAAWGIYHEAGVEAGKLQKIGGANKRCWKHIEETSQPWRPVEKSQVSQA